MSTPEEQQALADESLAAEIRALAMELQKLAPGTAPQLTKGIITAISNTSSPPTVSIQIAGDTVTTVSSVRLLNNYSPVVGHTVLIAKQGPDILIIGHIAEQSAFSVSNSAGGWIRATLAAGSHGGNSNGDIYYRRILDHGSWKMQWRGGWNVSGTTLVSGLPAEYRPSSLRSVVAPRQIATGAVALQWDFKTDGTVTLVGANQTAASASTSGDVLSRDPIDSTTGDFAGSTVTHNHGGAVAGSTITHGSTHSHGVVGSHDHGFTGGSHSHTVSTPTWAGLNGVEYFL